MNIAQHQSNMLQENFEDFFEQSLCGFVIATAQGIIIRVNGNVAAWAGIPAEELKGKRFSDLLSISGKVYYETHLAPLLRMQGFFEEVALEVLSADGSKHRVTVNGLERLDDERLPLFVRYTLSKASDRHLYEQNLKTAKNVAEKELLTQQEAVLLREQLIAVLGHDLRNPLSSMGMAIMLLESTLDDEERRETLAVLKRSSARMRELVNNIMDFARTRLGEGIILNLQHTILTPSLQHVIRELQLIFPHRQITSSFNISEPVWCDPHRIEQLISNLVANAITHGSPDYPVHIRATHQGGLLEIAVCNSGVPIPLSFHEQLFEPFKREGNRPSQQGLGLGLYISAEIARAHHGTLSFTSTEQETCFTFSVGPKQKVID